MRAVMQPGPARSQAPLRGVRRLATLVVGCLAMLLGALGVVLPLLPATPFILLAAACFASTWPRMRERLARNRVFGPMLSAGPGGRFLPVRTKLVVLGLTWISIGATCLWATRLVGLRAVLAGIALAVTALVAWMPSAPRPSSRNEP